MATTTTGDASKIEVVPPYDEQDKLGPIGGKRWFVDDSAELRRMLVAEFQAAADVARDAAARVDHQPASSVHEYRKALRRARAVLALVANALPKSERRALLRALREARRALGAARDRAVAPETISALTLDEVDRSTASAILAETEQAMPPLTEIKQLLAEGAARAAAQVEALEAALPREIPWRTVERGVCDVYDEARRARKAAKRSKRAFHRWRRRSKELTYQLDLLAGYAGERTADIHREIEHVTDTQGPAVDLLMLRELVRTHAAGIAPEAIDRLSEAIDDQVDDLIRDSRRAGRDAFRREPRRFARRLTKAVRRDLAPAVAADDIETD